VTEAERRGALREAIAAVGVAEQKRDKVKAAHDRGLTVIAGLERELTRYHDVDQDAPRDVKRTLERGGEPKPGRVLDERLKHDVTRRDRLRAELAATVTATEELATDLQAAEQVVADAQAAITPAHVAVLMCEIARLGDEHDALMKPVELIRRKLFAARSVVRGAWPANAMAAISHINRDHMVNASGWRAAADAVLIDPDAEIVIPDPGEITRPILAPPTHGPRPQVPSVVRAVPVGGLRDAPPEPPGPRMPPGQQLPVEVVFANRRRVGGAGP
jgi:hypothetical protein